MNLTSDEWGELVQNLPSKSPMVAESCVVGLLRVLLMFLWIEVESMWFRVNSTITFQLNLGAIRMEHISHFCLAQKKKISMDQQI